MRRVVAHLLGIMFLFTAAARAQEPSADPAPPADTRRADLGAFVRDGWRIWTSPLRRDSYSGHTVKKYVIPFALLSGALIATDTKTADMLPNTQSQTRWSGRVSQLGAGYSLAGLSGGTLLIGKMTGNRHAQETGWLALNALAHTQVVVAAVKQMTNRERPLMNDGAGGFWEGGDSFPSGHAASSFAVATVFAYEYRDKIAVPITAYGLAAAISASRMSARRHWVSDIVVGASTGFIIGRFIYKRHHDPSLPGSPIQETSPFVPRVSWLGTAVSVDWRF
jgi:membrane-associated phospholipid phosphatase